MAPPSVGPAFLVSQVGAHAALAFTDKLVSLDLKPHHAGILRMLGTNPGLTQKVLSTLLGIFPSQLVPLLDELESRKLVGRRDNPDDRRSYHLHLTAAGRKTLAKIGALTLTLEREMFAALNAKEKHLLTDLLARIATQQQITPGVHPAYRQLKGN